jgi:hypothetical protein
MIKFKCSQCQKAITAADEHVGRKAKCPGCQTILVIPKPSPPAPIKLDHVEVVDEVDEAPPPPRKAAPKPAPQQTSPAIKAGKPRREEYAEEEEEIPEVEAAEEEDFEVVEDEEEERPRKRRRVVVADEEDDEEEEERPRKKLRKKKKKRRWHGEWAECPNCGAPGDAYRLSWTWWGGMIGPLFICHVRCNRCGGTYNGKSGDYNTTRIIIYYAINLGVGLLIFIGCFGVKILTALSNH